MSNEQELFSFYSPQYGKLILSSGFPSGFKGPFLKGSKAGFFSRDFGQIILQQVLAGQFSLEFLLFDFLKKISFIFPALPGLQSLFINGGEGRILLPGNVKINLKESQYLLFHSSTGTYQIEINDRQRFYFLRGHYSAEMVEELIPAFPELENFLKRRTKNSFITPAGAHHPVKDAVRQIIHAEFEASRLPFYFKNKVEAYLFELLEQTANAQKNNEIQPTFWEREALYKIRSWILTDILQHSSIRELAVRAKMNPFRLKLFFKREFGVGTYEFLLNARMDKIVELMKAGMPMKEAAPLAGYRTTSFITAFRRRYGYTPGSIGRKNQ